MIHLHRLGIAFVFLVVALAGCATIQPQTTATVKGRGYINERAQRQVATLNFRDGRTIKAHTLRILTDSLTWIDPESGAFQSAAVSDVVTISFYTRRHLWRNLALGGLIGAASGFILGYSFSEPGSGFFSITREQAGTLAAIGLGITGAGVGALTGIDHTNRDVYVVQDPER